MPSSAEIVATLVPRESVAEIWPHVAPHIAAALAVSGDYSPEGARARCEAGDWLLWFAARPGEVVAAAITGVERHELRSVLYVLAAGGEAADGVKALWPLLKACAEMQGCSAVRFLGRRGWARSGALPAGWRHCFDVVEVAA